jgi:hypothetical protein
VAVSSSRSVCRAFHLASSTAGARRSRSSDADASSASMALRARERAVVSGPLLAHPRARGPVPSPPKVKRRPPAARQARRASRPELLLLARRQLSERVDLALHEAILGGELAQRGAQGSHVAVGGGVGGTRGAGAACGRAEGWGAAGAGRRGRAVDGMPAKPP